ncbi:MAG: hypothetical protein KJN61_07455 [Gammaproteobacteria bacterium]|nr:hypothetical protein [Gammaproteobacteria bacterium]
MPVTKDRRYVEDCARVNRENVKVGKAKDFAFRRSNYWKAFGKENVVIEPLVFMSDTSTAETAILRALKLYRKLSPKGGKLEWLEGISYEDAKRIVYAALDEQGFDYVSAAETDI